MSNNKKPTKKEKYEMKKKEKMEAKEKKLKTEKIKRIGMWIGLTVVIIGSLIVMVNLASNEPEGGGNATPQQVNAEDWTKGGEQASVEILEYADFQCPACADAKPALERLSEDFGDDLKIALRHFPLEAIHPNAQLASQAAEAAGLQGKFWEMHDMLFENQRDWSRERNPEDKFISYAEFLELDIEKFEADLKSDAVKDAVDSDQNAGFKAGVNSTPTFYLNGERIQNLGYEGFKTLIEEELSKSSE
ncbi:MAG: thioredoxin domain-containing protein [Candidatus Spechtbacterales bacterium]|nr:thioredoxin domain-containing protein [Candidatus Spechtbacterales bacterium]